MPPPELSANTSVGFDFDRDAIFSLIDRAIPFEACLYHQILPLSLVDNQLRLGMVDLTDVSALDYLRKVLVYLPYGLAPQAMPLELHHQLLSGYLKFKSYQEAIAPVEEPTVFFERPKQSNLSTEGAADSSPTLFFDRPVTNREEVKDKSMLASQGSSGQNSSQPSPSPSIPHSDDRPDRETQTPIAQPSPSQESHITSPQSSTVLPLAVPGSALPLLQVNTLEYSDEQLLELMPKELLEVLLGRILSDGIGRLFFQHQSTQGRVLSSDSGVFQTVIENLPIETFEGVIAELKRLMALPLNPVNETLQAEIERLYEKNRILLRLRLMPKQNADGQDSTSANEDATLQILWGSALRFYQQQQASSLSRDTITVARQLQRKVEELYRRSNAHRSVDAEELSIMPELQEVLQSVKNKLTEIERQTIGGSNNPE